MKLKKTRCKRDANLKRGLNSAIGCNRLVRLVRPKPWLNETTGEGRQRSPVSLAGNGRQTTTDFDNCVSTSVRHSPSLQQDRKSVNSDRPRCRGVSAILRRATGHQSLRQACPECNRRAQDRPGRHAV